MKPLRIEDIDWARRPAKPHWWHRLMPSHRRPPRAYRLAVGELVHPQGTEPTSHAHYYLMKDGGLLDYRASRYVHPDDIDTHFREAATQILQRAQADALPNPAEFLTEAEARAILRLQPKDPR